MFEGAKSGLFEARRRGPGDTIAEETRGGILGILVSSLVWADTREYPQVLLKDNRLSSGDAGGHRVCAC